MKYLDTNVIVRMVTGDLPDVAKSAFNKIQSGNKNEYTVLDAVLVETCFVLEFHDYKMARTDLADALQTLLSTPQIFATDVSKKALRLYKEHIALDYVDCLLFICGGKQGVFTFDSEFQKQLLS